MTWTKWPVLLSYPPLGWRIRGGANFRSKDLPPTNPQAAFREWLAFADALADLGVEAVVHEPPAVEPPLTGLIYAANHGAWFPGDERFVVSRMHVAHRRDESPHVQQFMTGLGLVASQAEHVWEGQADVVTVGNNRFILTWGVRTVVGANAEIARHLGDQASILSVRIRDPYFHGDTCLNLLPRAQDRPVLMVFPGALVDATVDDLAAFTGAEMLEISKQDTHGYACNSLLVGDTLLTPTGLSEELQVRLGDLGFTVRALDLSELFGKGGGGPRCLANQLWNLDVDSLPAASRYSVQRDGLYLKVGEYPDSA